MLVSTWVHIGLLNRHRDEEVLTFHSSVVLLLAIRVLTLMGRWSRLRMVAFTSLDRYSVFPINVLIMLMVRLLSDHGGDGSVHPKNPSSDDRGTPLPVGFLSDGIAAVRWTDGTLSRPGDGDHTVRFESGRVRGESFVSCFLSRVCGMLWNLTPLSATAPHFLQASPGLEWQNPDVGNFDTIHDAAQTLFKTVWWTEWVELFFILMDVPMVSISRAFVVRECVWKLMMFVDLHVRIVWMDG